MSAFDLDEQGEASVDEWARANLLNEAAPAPPGALKNLDEGVAKGVMRGGARAAQSAGTLVGGPIAQAIDAAHESIDDTASLADTVSDIFGAVVAGHQESMMGGVPAPQDSLHTEAQDALFGAVDDVATNAVDYWTPNAGEVGKAGEVIGGLSEIALPLMVTGGNPSLLIGQSTTGPAVDLVRGGADAATATKVGVTQGLATAAGFKMPFLGKSLATKALSGALGNTVVNAGAAAAQREELLAGGYEELAKNYNPLDLEARAIDVLTGIAFGGIDHVTTRSLKPSQVAAVATAANAKHFQYDTAPGRPTSGADAQAHQDAMETATEQTLAGEPVAVDPAVTHANFIPRPETAPVEIPAELVALDEARAADSVKSDAAQGGEGYDVAEGVLTDEQLAQFQGLRSDVPADENASGTVSGTPAPEGAGDAGGARTGEPLAVFRGADRPLEASHFEEEALGRASGNPSSGLGVYFTNDATDAARYGPVVESALLDIRNPKVIAIEDFPAFDTIEEATAYRKQLQAEGHDGIVVDISHLGGPTQYVAFGHHQVIPAKRIERKAAAKKPGAQAKVAGGDASGAQSSTSEIPHDVTAAQDYLLGSDILVPTGEIDADGNPVARSARELMAEADAEIAQAEADAVGYEAAVNCFLSRGADAT